MLIDFEAYRKKEEIIQATVDQLNKDLLVDHFTVDYSGDTEGAYIEIFAQVQQFVDELQKNTGAFQSMLYRVDVPEKKVARIYRTERREDIVSAIAELIIDREFQKVILREYFKQNSK